MIEDDHRQVDHYLSVAKINLTLNFQERQKSIAFLLSIR